MHKKESLALPVHQLSKDPCEADYMLFPVQTNDCKPLQTTMMVEGHKLTIEVNTGAAVSLVSEEIVNSSLFPMCMSLLQQTNVTLLIYTGQLCQHWANLLSRSNMTRYKKQCHYKKRLKSQVNITGERLVK